MVSHKDYLSEVVASLECVNRSELVSLIRSLVKKDKFARYAFCKHLEEYGLERPETESGFDLLEGRLSAAYLQSEYSIDALLAGRKFGFSNMHIALREALDFAGSKGIVLTMPELLAVKIKADDTHDFWNNNYTVHSEENHGIDKKGIFYGRNDPVLVIVHGGGLLTPGRIEQAKCLADGGKYTDKEFDSLLKNRLPSGEYIHLYHFEEIKKGIPNLPHRYGVVMPYALAQATKSDYHRKKDFLKNPLVIARTGNLENLEAYFNRAKFSETGYSETGKLSNSHPFEGWEASPPGGHFLDLAADCFGLGNSHWQGRFLAVAPEAHSVSTQRQVNKSLQAVPPKIMRNVIDFDCIGVVPEARSGSTEGTRDKVPESPPPKNKKKMIIELD